MSESESILKAWEVIGERVKQLEADVARQEQLLMGNGNRLLLAKLLKEEKSLKEALELNRNLLKSLMN